MSQGKELLKRQPWIVSGVMIFLTEFIYRELFFMVGVLLFSFSLENSIHSLLFISDVPYERSISVCSLQKKIQLQLSKLTLTVSKFNTMKITEICQKYFVFSLSIS